MIIIPENIAWTDSCVLGWHWADEDLLVQTECMLLNGKGTFILLELVFRGASVSNCDLPTSQPLIFDGELGEYRDHLEIDDVVWLDEECTVELSGKAKILRLSINYSDLTIRSTP